MRDSRRIRYADGEALVTENELTESLKRLGYGVLHAEDIMRDVRLHREPEWEPGDVVRDANGIVWLRITGKKWARPGMVGPYSDDQPVRPLGRATAAGWSG